MSIASIIPPLSRPLAVDAAAFLGVSAKTLTNCAA